MRVRDRRQRGCHPARTRSRVSNPRVRSIEEAVVLLHEAAEDLRVTGLLPAAEQMHARADRAAQKLALLRALAMDEGGHGGTAAPP